MRTTHGTILLAALLAGFGCDGGGPVETPDSGPVVLEDGGPGTPDACTGCSRDSGPTGDGNDDFATATAITPGGTGETGLLNPPGDLDYYTFEGTEGQWIVIDTEANPDDDPTMVDTVITLYDSTMTRIAENDDGLPRANTDSELVTRLPSTGTFYVLVQEWTTWAGDPDEGMESFEYTLTVTELNDTAPEVNIDTEAGDVVATAQALTARAFAGGDFALIAGTFDDATDVDVYSFAIPAGAGGNYSVSLMPHGATGNGAAAPTGRLWITNADGSEIVARIDPSMLIPGLNPGATVELGPALDDDATYLLFVEHGASGGESGSFYVLKAIRVGDNPLEMGETTNNVPATADPISFDANPNAPEGFTRRSGFVLAHLGTADIDHFSIDVAATELVSVYCGSRSSGSGVVDLTVTLLDATGATEVASNTESATDGALIESEAVPSAGTYLVRLTKASQDPEVAGDFVRCGFHLDLPAP